jgi:hypothetical protein
MGKKQGSQAGFSAVTVVVVVFVVLIILAIGGWILYSIATRSDSSTPKPTPAAKAPASTSSTSDATATTKLYLDNSRVSYSLPADWEAIAATDAASFPCGQAVTSKVTAADCLDRAVFVLNQDGYSANQDQFYAEAAVFTNASSLNSKDWFGQLGLAGSSGTGSDETINGVTAYKYTMHPEAGNNNRFDVYYAIAKGNLAVLVHSELFNGDHYSYKTANNYLTNEGAIGDIAGTIAFAQ